MSLSQHRKGREPKKRHRIFDETGKRLLREIRPLRGWVLLSAFICLVLIGCAVAVPELLGGLIDRLYEWTRSQTPGLARSLVPGLALIFGIFALRAVLTYGKYYLLQSVVSRYFCAGFRIRLSDKLRRLPVSFMDKTPAGDVIDRMMDDVSNMADSVFGFVDIPGFDNTHVQCFEFLENENPLCLFTDISNFDSAWDTAFESRYPDTSTPDLQPLKTLATWINACRSDQQKWNDEKADHFDLYGKII